MARHQINTIPIFKETVCGALGTAGTILSDPIDLREISRVGNYSLSYSINGGGAATAGSSTFEYLGCSVFDGTYIAPTGGTFGTQGNSITQAGILSFSPVTIPFMKIKAVTGTSNLAAFTVELNIR